MLVAAMAFPLRATHPDRLRTQHVQRSEMAVNQPASPSILSAPFSPLIGHRTSPVMNDDYQPQHWAADGRLSSAVRTRSTVGSTGMEANFPSPPPPYSASHPSVSRHSNANVPHRAALSPTSLPLLAQCFQRETLEESSSPLAHSSHSVFPYQDFFHDGLLSPRTLAGVAPDPTQQFDPAEAPGARRCHSTPAFGSGPISPRPDHPHHSQGPWQPGMAIPPPPPGPPPAAVRAASSSRVLEYSRAANSRSAIRPYPKVLPNHPLSPIPPTPATADGVPDTITQPKMPIEDMSYVASPPQEEPDTDQADVRHDAIDYPIRDRRWRSRVRGQSSTFAETPGNIENGTDAFRPSSLYISPPDPTRLASSRFAIRPPQASDVDASKRHKSAKGTTKPIGTPTPPYTPPTKYSGDGEDLAASVEQVILSFRQGALSSKPATDTGNADSASAIVNQKDAFLVDSLERFLRYIRKETTANNDQERLLLFAQYTSAEAKVRSRQYAAALQDVSSELHEASKNMWPRCDITDGPSSGAMPPSASSASSMYQSAESLTPRSNRLSGVTFHSGALSERDLTPATEAGTSFNDLEHEQATFNQSPWKDRFKPALSPIPSMDVSTRADHDDLDSRGRSVSRWWETSDSDSAAGARRVERTKRESKYMSLHPSVIQQAAQTLSSPQPQDGQDHQLGREEYPPEKIGLEGDDRAGPSRSASLAAARGPVRTETGNDPARSLYAPLDVSRLVTLPPPYPRHYPAVNNCHPQLDSPRKRHRDIANLEWVRKQNENLTAKEEDVRAQIDAARAERVKQFRAGVQGDIDRGFVDHSIAREADRRFRSHEAERSAQAAQEAQQYFQTNLYEPVHEVLATKAAEADVCINMMELALSSTFASEQQSTEQAQVAGDEEPEMLEQLTLLKWLFEARENVHKELFDLSIAAVRRARVAEKWSPKYRSLSQEERDESDNAFTSRCNDMQLNFATESSARFQVLLAIIDEHVSRGVEAQLSAFWDVAPQIGEVLSKIPQPAKPRHGDADANYEDEDELYQDPGPLAANDHLLSQLPILIPPSELQDNPGLRSNPAQYLYTTLSHAHNSVRQFVDAQVDLLCLQHEIQTAAMAARVRVLEVQRSRALREEGRTPVLGADGTVVGWGNTGDDVEEEELREMQAARRVQEQGLTADLKRKVQEVEAGWDEALGVALRRCRAVVKGFLVRGGGWDDALDE